MIRAQEVPVVMEEVTDPVELAQARGRRERFDRNWEWFKNQAPQVYAAQRGKCIWVAGQELFVGDDPQEGWLGPPQPIRKMMGDLRSISPGKEWPASNPKASAITLQDTILPHEQEPHRPSKSCRTSSGKGWSKSAGTMNAPAHSPKGRNCQGIAGTGLTSARGR